MVWDETAPELVEDDTVAELVEDQTEDKDLQVQ